MSDQLDLADRYAIIETCTRLAELIDDCRWDDFDQVLADHIDIDYTSLFGGEPARVTSTDLPRTLARLLGNMASTQHLVSGHLVTGSGDSADCISQVQAVHVKHNDTGDSHWTAGCQYEMKLVRVAPGWRISAIKVVYRWSSGNREVMRLGRVPRSLAGLEAEAVGEAGPVLARGAEQ